VADKISEAALNRMALQGGKVRRAPKPEPEPAPAPAAPTPAPAPVQDNSIPFASMQASMNVINEQLGRVVDQNSQVIEGLRTSLDKDPPARKPWRLKVVRDRGTKLIDFVDAIPMEMRK